MTVVAVDDTDSRTQGMCTTYLAAVVAAELTAAGHTVERRLLVRLHPAVEHKTRGNAAVAVHTDAPPAVARETAVRLVEEYAVVDDDRTSPGVVVAPGEDAHAGESDDGVRADGTTESADGSTDPVDSTPDPVGSTPDPVDSVPEPVVSFARDAVRGHCSLDRALTVAETAGYETVGWGRAPAGRGRIGALAAVGAWAAFDDWTYERIAYREFARCGTERDVDEASVFAAATDAYPAAWDTVDRVEGEAVCVPNAPGPILYGIRGDDPAATATVADRIESEPVERRALFVTNQGTDAHLRRGTLCDSAGDRRMSTDTTDAMDTTDRPHRERGRSTNRRETERDESTGGREAAHDESTGGREAARDGSPEPVRDGRAYRVDGVVASDPETRAGGHVFFALAPPSERSSESDCHSAEGRTVDCVAFEPTKRFRDHVRALRAGDELTVCGEFTDGTLKLEKFAVRRLDCTALVVPNCPDCGRSMESAGRGQGYRCRDCSTSTDGRVETEIDRELERGWYEVPPCARRHVAKPLVRGGFDAPTHPEW